MVIGESILLPAEALLAIRAHAARSYPEECCGGLLGVTQEGVARRVVQCSPLQNARGDERNRRYLIGPEAVRSIERDAEAAGLELIGFYHSHPDHPASPSWFDRDHAWPWYSYVIVPVDRGVAGPPRAWRLREDREGFEEQEILEAGETA
jgi:proteasome lid subunit RPN8/RPN11